MNTLLDFDSLATSTNIQSEEVFISFGLSLRTVYCRG